MNERQRIALSLRETDIGGALYRCCGSEELYSVCLKSFLEDKTMDDLCEAVDARLWDAAFTAAHALKGLAGNMGFVPLMHATGQLVVLMRGGRTSEIGESLDNVRSCYRDIIDGINQFFTSESLSEEKGTNQYD